MNTPAAGVFAAHLPLTYSMTDYANREKHALMGFSIDDSLLKNITAAYEIGDIAYYPLGPAFAMYYDHDGRTIADGMAVIARMDQTGADALRAYAGCVEVTCSAPSYGGGSACALTPAAWRLPWRWPGDSTCWKRTGVGTVEAISFQLASKLPLRGFRNRMERCGVTFFDTYLLHNKGVNLYKNAAGMEPLKWESIAGLTSV